ncbi:hypothetical protein [Aeromicrobium endophyticum]|uniref:Uncharacterized protein n=1 Tax=Aeromicrobium endophyticum TaxID=2292704 RepID=A0A371P286_9ACTN|nr:hypothetical protein [Aeromicrobium endophyticum]REK69718.1 hypothetical protein DX116_10970 [Aeromicrobium endophyticum]
MTSRSVRLVMFVPVVVTLLTAAAVGAAIVVQDHRETARMARADEVAEAFLSDVGMFRGDVARVIARAREAEPAELRRVLASAVADPPELGEPPAGAERSETYASATATARTFLAPYRRLDRQLRRADVALTFVGAAREALETRATDYVGFGPIGDSAAVRTRLVPAFVEARDDFADVRVPKGQRALAATVREALQYVIDRAGALADSIEVGRSYSFSYTQEFTAAADAVDDYATTVEGDLAEALNAVTASG